MAQRNSSSTGGLGVGLIKMLNVGEYQKPLHRFRNGNKSLTTCAVSARVLYQKKTGQDLTNVGIDLKERIINDYFHALHERGLDQFWNSYGFSNFPK